MLHATSSLNGLLDREAPSVLLPCPPQVKLHPELTPCPMGAPGSTGQSRIRHSKPGLVQKAFRGQQREWWCKSTMRHPLYGERREGKNSGTGIATLCAYNVNSEVAGQFTTSSVHKVFYYLYLHFSLITLR